MRIRWHTRIAGATMAVALITACGENGTEPELETPDPPGVGAIQVVFRTPGPTVDPDGFSVTLDGVETQNAAATGEVTFTGVEAGTHEITIGGIATNCAIDGGTTFTQSVVAEVTVTLTLSPWCVGPIPSDIAIVFVTGPEGFNRGDALGMSSTDLAGIRADGSEEVTIVEGLHPDSLLSAWTFADPVWSPDGSQILIVRDGNLSEELWLAQADGSGLTHIASGRLPTWSPDGRRVAFVFGRAGEPGRLVIVDADGSNRDELDLGTGVSYVAWSPDGLRLAVEVAESPWGAGRGVAVVNTDGSGLTHVGGPIDGARRDASWSPDGDRIAYRVTLGVNNPWSLYGANPDGSGEVELLTLTGGASVRRPTWSPTGEKILFSRYVVDCGPNAGHACPPNLSSVTTNGGVVETLVHRQPSEAGTWRPTP